MKAQFLKSKIDTAWIQRSNLTKRYLKKKCRARISIYISGKLAEIILICCRGLVGFICVVTATSESFKLLPKKANYHTHVSVSLMDMT